MCTLNVLIDSMEERRLVAAIINWNLDKFMYLIYLLYSEPLQMEATLSRTHNAGRFPDQATSTQHTLPLPRLANRSNL